MVLLLLLSTRTATRTCTPCPLARIKLVFLRSEINKNNRQPQ
jgi:hypothetical protein